MPASTGVVQEAGVPRAALDLDQAQPAGAERLQAVGGAQLGHGDAGLASRRASATCPAGTVTGLPSISSVTMVSALRAGVP